jgi:dipeptidyl aminopeptidase/acylaminoacyl peptidase
VAGRRYPVLLNIHGGPAAQYGNVFFDEFQSYTGAGYAVVFTNPRGSQGYGEAFCRATVGNWGDRDYADVMAVLNAALTRFDWLDPDRLGVMGGSYGGYLTTWIIGHTDRFRAACSERAVNNLATLFASSDIGARFARGYVGGTPWQARATHERVSPISYVDAIRTPTLILHGEDDLRCPIGEAEQLFVALKAQNVETLFARFPGANHEMSRTGRPRQRLARFELILDWFRRFIPP